MGLIHHLKTIDQHLFRKSKSIFFWSLTDLFRLSEIVGTGTFVNYENYSVLHEYFLRDMANSSSSYFPSIPVGFKRVQTAIGVCFEMATKLSGTTERKFQGTKRQDFFIRTKSISFFRLENQLKIKNQWP